MSKVLLNGNVIFDEEKYTLTHRNSQNDTIILGATTSRCLGLFIANQAEVIYKKDLLHNGWGKFGTVVAEGSMWQVISQLRKAFEHFNLDGGLIITVPRIGYKLSSELTIECANSLEEEDGDFAPEEMTRHTSVLPVTKEPDEAELSQVLPADITSSNHSRIFSARVIKIWLIAGGVNLLLLTCLYLYQSKPDLLPTLAQSWHFSQQLNDSAIYVQKNKPAMAYITEQAIARLENHAALPDGTQAAYIYINNTSDNSLSSYFLCKREITERDNGCITSVMVDKTSR